MYEATGPTAVRSGATDPSGGYNGRRRTVLAAGDRIVDAAGHLLHDMLAH